MPRDLRYTVSEYIVDIQQGVKALVIYCGVDETRAGLIKRKSAH